MLVFLPQWGTQNQTEKFVAKRFVVVGSVETCSYFRLDKDIESFKISVILIL